MDDGKATASRNTVGNATAPAAAAPLPKPVLQRALQQATVEELMDALVTRGWELMLRRPPRETPATV
jgi:hypothetical protein